MKTTITTVTTTDTISRELRFKLQIAAETIISNAFARREEGISSRVLADDIVDMVVGVLDGSNPLPSGDQLAPWKAFAIKK